MSLDKKIDDRLETMLDRLEKQANQARDFIVPIKDTTMNPDGNLEFQDHSIKPTNWASTQISSYAEVPKQYADRIRSENPGLYADSINHGFRRKPKDLRLVRTTDEGVRGFLSNRFQQYDSIEFAKHNLPTIVKAGFRPWSAKLTEKNMWLEMIYPEISFDIKPGDKVSPGFRVRNSDVGCGSFEITMFFWRSLCDNGQAMGQSLLRKVHLGRAVSGAEDLYTIETRRKTEIAIMAQTKDVVMALTKPDYFKRQVEQMQQAAGQKIEGNVSKVVDVTIKHLGLNESLKDGIINMLAGGNEGAGMTRWGLANSLTGLAKDQSDYEDRMNLERAGGNILELNATQWRTISEAA